MCPVPLVVTNPDIITRIQVNLTIIANVPTEPNVLHHIRAARLIAHLKVQNRVNTESTLVRIKETVVLDPQFPYVPPPIPGPLEPIMIPLEPIALVADGP